MTLRQNKEMQELEKELIYILNPYGFKILLTHESHKYNDYALYCSNYRDFSDHMLIYNIDKKKATIAFANDDRQTINFILLGNKFSPIEMPYSISDRGEEQWLIENIIQKCKMTITILDRGDEEHGYEEDRCDRELKHTVYIDGIIQNRRA